MRFPIAAIVIGSVMLAGAGAAFAQSARTNDTAAFHPSAAVVDSSADRDSYLHKARKKTAEWRRKMDELNKKAAADGKQAAIVAEDDVTKAWARVKIASRRLENASADGWEAAKATFEKASHNLEATWHKRHPGER